jgi:hypothetical protein
MKAGAAGSRVPPSPYERGAVDERNEDARERTNRGPGSLSGGHRFAWQHGCIAGAFVAVLVAGCSGGVEATSHSGNVGSDGGGPSVLTVDGTTGQPCTTDAQCAAALGPGVNQCSNGFVATVAGVTGQPLPAPVCTLPPTTDNCDPAPSSDPLGDLPHFCDGQDDPSSPGLCVADDPSNPVSGMGTCQPKCTFAVNGATATGCVAPDTCVVANFAAVQSGTSLTVAGYGYCQGTCQHDADCPSQMGVQAFCQTDVGLCTTQPVARTLAVGDACTASDYQAGACNCNFDPVSLVGYCTTVCVVGGTPCPTGWVCDTGEPSTLNLGSGNITVSTQTAGLAGYCAPACGGTGVAIAGAAIGLDAGAGDGGDAGIAAGMDAEIVETGELEAGAPDAGPPEAGSILASDAAADSGSPGALACPAGSTCVSGTVAGPDCVP